MAKNIALFFLIISGLLLQIPPVFGASQPHSASLIDSSGNQESVASQRMSQIDALMIKAASCKDEQDYQQTIKLYNRALALAKKESDPLRLSTLHYYLAEVFLDVKNYTMAISEFEACLKLKDKVYRPELFAHVYFQMGAIYYDFKNFELSLSFYQSALREFKALKQEYIIGEVLDSIGSVYLGQGRKKDALEYNLKSLKYKRETSSNREVAELLLKIGALYLDLGKNNLSLKYLQEASSYTALFEGGVIKGEIEAKLGLASYNLGAYKDAEEHFHVARRIAEKAKDRPALAEIYKNLAVTYEKLDDRVGEVSYFRKYIGLKDSLLAEENQKKIDKIKAEFEVQNKQRAIEILEHQKALLSSQAEMKDMAIRTNKILLIFFVSVFILSFILLVLLIRRHTARRNSNLVLQNHLAEVRQQKNQIEGQRDLIEQNNQKLEQARKIIVHKNKLLEENNSFLEKTINERTLELYKAYQKLSFHVDNTSLAVMEFNDRLELIRWFGSGRNDLWLESGRGFGKTLS